MEVGYGKRVAADVLGDEVFQKIKMVAGILPETWNTPGTAWDVTNYGDVEIQIAGTITTPYQPQRSLDGSNFVNCLAYDEAGNSYSTISAPGIYSLSGGGFLRLNAGAGTGITVTRRASA